MMNKRFCKMTKQKLQINTERLSKCDSWFPKLNRLWHNLDLQAFRVHYKPAIGILNFVCLEADGRSRNHYMISKSQDLIKFTDDAGSFT